ncbi:unnamed protein product [Chrysodeixis includens]|uniref:Uncharacterized protein n=1 Tax=Chrysodeixis includens TaxID=689277 RepID=A0A9N8KVF5_CHRIL|nr:unnamed protein product [Chrysodeixis includens]
MLLKNDIHKSDSDGYKEVKAIIEKHQKLLRSVSESSRQSSSEVADAAYQSYWYESDVKVKKLILFIMIRAQRPCYLSALGFSDLTLRSFSKIMSSSWTYLSLLLQVYEET